jgi:transcriptional regulator with XRE-family HTH domain
MVALPFCHFEIKTKKPLSKAYPKELLTLGDHIRKRRLGLMLTQKQVAHAIGVDEATVWNWEKDRTKPLTKQIPAIVSFLGYDPFPSGDRTLADKVLRYRLSNGLSLKKLAMQIGIDPATLSRLERSNGKSFNSITSKVSGFIRDRTRN